MNQSLHKPKRMLSLLLTLCLVLTMLPAISTPASAGLTTTGTISTAGSQTLSSSTLYKVTANTTVNSGRASKNGLVINSGTVIIYIAPNVTLTVYGQNGNGPAGGGAAIYLPSGASLIVTGGGTLNAHGGSAGSGASGTKGYNGGSGVTNRCTGGPGGYGGGGGGAGIGTNGGLGGTGGPGGNWTSTYYGGVGNPGGSASAAGAVYKLGSVTINGYGGAIGSGGSGGPAGSWQSGGDAGGGGGGGGGRGGQGAGIGTGGQGGGGGGGGSSAHSGWGGGGGGGGGWGGQGGTAGTGSSNNSAYAGNHGTASTSAAGGAGGLAKSGVGKNTYGGTGGTGGGSGTAKSIGTTSSSNMQYSLARNANGGTSLSAVTMTFGVVTSAGTASRAGYTFKGWYTATSGGTQVFSGTGAPVVSAAGYTDSSGAWTYANNVTLHAQWTPNNYTVTFNANSGTGTMARQTMTYDTAKSLTLNQFTRTGFSFIGWATTAVLANAGTVAYQNGASVKNLTSAKNGNYNLYAVWKGDKVTVKLDMCGIIKNASGVEKSLEIEPGTSFAAYYRDYTAPPGVSGISGIPRRDNMVFMGYYDQASGGTQYIDNLGQGTAAIWMGVGANLKLYAQWAPTPNQTRIENGSFENPKNTGWINNPTDQSTIAGQSNNIYWFTTASDHQLEVLNIDKGASSIKSHFNATSVPDGSQFAELNANQAGALYQTLTTYPGDELYYSLHHKGRRGSDVMQVWIGSPEDVNTAISQYKSTKTTTTGSGKKKTTTTLTNSVELVEATLLARINGQAAGNKREYTTGNTAWKQYSGTYTVPYGQTETVFAFVSVSGAGGDPTIGNLLDNIVFASEMPEITLPVRISATTNRNADVFVDDCLVGTVTPAADLRITPGEGSVLHIIPLIDEDYETYGALVNGVYKDKDALDAGLKIADYLAAGSMDIVILIIKKGVLTLDAAGGTLAGGAEHTIGSENSPFPLPTPTREGWKFGGWKVIGAANDSARLDGGDTVVFAANEGTETATLTAMDGAAPVHTILTGSTGMLMVAQWGYFELYSVEFTFDLGSDYADADRYLQRTLNDASTPLALPAPVREGYAFTGWQLPDGTAVTSVAYAVSKEHVCSYQINGGAAVTLHADAAVTLAAIWAGDTVELALSGGGKDDLEGQNHDFLTGKAGEAFGGSALTVTVTNDGTMDSGDVTVTLLSGDDSKFLSPGTITGIAVGGDGSFVIQPRDNLPAGRYTETVTVSANGDSASFTVTYTVLNPSVSLDLNGGSLTGEGMTEYAPSTDAETPLPTPVKTGQVFTGWYESESGTTVTAIAAGSTGDKAYTAQWEACLHPGSDADCTRSYLCTCGVVVPSTGHRFAHYAQNTDGDCVTPHTETAFCENAGCSAVHTRVTTSLGEHDWGSWLTSLSPSCDEDGLEERTCSICARVEYRDIAATSHDLAAETPVPPTCTTSGYTAYHCTHEAHGAQSGELCGYIEYDMQPGDAVAPLGHSLGSYTHDCAGGCTDASAGHNQTCTNFGCSYETAAEPHAPAPSAPALSDLSIDLACADCGHIIRAALEPVSSSVSDKTAPYSGTPMNVIDIGCFAKDVNAGAPTFTLLSVSGGAGTLAADGTVSVTAISADDGAVFTVSVTTAQTATHLAGAAQTFTLTVIRGSQAAPAGSAAAETAPDQNDGEITGLPPGTYEYREGGTGSWVTAVVGADGKIGPLSPGTYDVRKPGNSLFEPGDILTVEIKECYKITWNLGGGGWKGAAPVTRYYKGDTLTLPASTGIEREGFSFIGWYADIGRTSPAFGITAGTTGDLLFVADWQGEIYRIATSAPTGGSFSVRDRTAAEITQAGFLDTVTINTISQTGYVVEAVVVAKDGGGTVSATGSEGRYQFSMPADGVTISVRFKLAYNTSAEVTIKAPATGDTPATTGAVETAPAGSSAALSGLTWSPETAETGKFIGQTSYTATFVLTAEDGLLFAEDFSATVPGASSVEVELGQGGSTAAVTAAYPITAAKTVAGITDETDYDHLQSGGDQSSYYTYMSGDRLDLREVVIEITYNDGTREEISLPELIRGGAVIEIGGDVFKPGSDTLKRDDGEGNDIHHGKKISVSYQGGTVELGTLTVFDPPTPQLSALRSIFVTASEVTGILDLSVAKGTNDFDVKLQLSGGVEDFDDQGGVDADIGSTAVSVTGLTPGAQYTAALTATDGVTGREYSIAKTFTTPSFVPAAPGDKTFPLPGTIIDPSGSVVIWVSLYKGPELLQTLVVNPLPVGGGSDATTCTFTFGDITPGIYNLVADNGSWLVTHGVVMQDDGKGTIEPPIVIDMGSGHTQSVIEHSAEAPVVVSEWLPEFFAAGNTIAIDDTDTEEEIAQKEAQGYTDANAAVVKSGGMVEIVLVVGGESVVTGEDKALLQEVAETESKVVGAYMDLSLVKNIYPVVGQPAEGRHNLTEAAVLLKLTVDIPESVAGKKGLSLVRLHGGGYVPLPLAADETNTAGIECYSLNSECTVATLWVNRFSPYAFIHDPDPVNTGDSSSTSTELIITGADGGSLTVNLQKPKKGDTVTLTPNPEGGFTLGSITIKDASGKDVPYTLSEDGAIRFTMPGGKVTVTPRWKRAFDVSWMLNTTDHMAYMQGYPGGNFRPLGNMSRAEMAQMFYNLLRDKEVFVTGAFSDVPAGAWYAEAVNVMAALGITLGYPDGSYRPHDPITRAQFTAVVVRFTQYTEQSDAAARFTDVAKSHWAYSYIGAAYEFGLVNGLNAEMTLFSPDRNISRAEAAAMTNRILGRYPDAQAIDTWEALLRFPDADERAWYWYDVMEAANAHEYERDSDAEKETWVSK